MCQENKLLTSLTGHGGSFLGSATYLGSTTSMGCSAGVGLSSKHVPKMIRQNYILICYNAL